MKKTLKIDFVSDVSCPWCVIGLRGLEQALREVADDLEATVHFQPFELNPQMPAEGQDLDEHLLQKYGRTAEQFADTREAIRARGAELGFEFRMDRRNRIYNTFDAHRLLHWAAGSARQQALKHALFRAYFTDGRAPSDHDVLVDAAASVGLDAGEARQILDSDRFAAEVRATERRYTDSGIHAVPAVIVDDQYLIQGGQPPEVFAQALRQIAAKAGQLA